MRIFRRNPRLFLILFLIFFLTAGTSLVAANPKTGAPELEAEAVPAFYQEGEANPAARYLWQWIKFGCYTLGGAAGAMGLMFGIFGFWVGRGPIIKQGIISAVAGFAFVLVIPFVRIVFSEWVAFAEEDPYLPEVQSSRLWVPEATRNLTLDWKPITRSGGG